MIQGAFTHHEHCSTLVHVGAVLYKLRTHTHPLTLGKYHSTVYNDQPKTFMLPSISAMLFACEEYGFVPYLSKCSQLNNSYSVRQTSPKELQNNNNTGYVHCFTFRSFECASLNIELY